MKLKNNQNYGTNDKNTNKLKFNKKNIITIKNQNIEG
jgi:hypothetical protein